MRQEETAASHSAATCLSGVPPEATGEGPRQGGACAETGHQARHRAAQVLRQRQQTAPLDRRACAADAQADSQERREGRSLQEHL